MKKIIILLLLIFLAAMAAGGYFLHKYSATKSLGKINFGYEAWIGVMPYVVAYEKGFFDEQGLEVELIYEESYDQEIAHLLSGRVDFIGDFALVDVVRSVSEGNDLKVVLATDYSNGGDGIAARKNLKEIKDLRGKKVAVEKDTLSEYLLYDALKKNGLSLADVSEINLSAPEAAQAFIDGKVDAAVTYEPDFTKAIEQGGGWRLYTSAQSLGLITDALTFRADYVENNPEKVIAVIKAYIKAIDFVRAQPEEAYRISAKYFNLTPTDLKKQIAGIKFLTKADNLEAFNYQTSLDSLHGAIMRANSYLLESKTIKNKIDSTDILMPRFIRDIEDNIN
ncbi:MAG: aliphatic sulfonate ABC transporter substrate-binding protein [Candidatus Buchananbacteria bacterium]